MYYDKSRYLTDPSLVFNMGDIKNPPTRSLFISQDLYANKCALVGGVTWSRLSNGTWVNIFDGLTGQINLPALTSISYSGWVNCANSNVDKMIYNHGIETGDHRSFGIAAAADAHFYFYTSPDGFWNGGNLIFSTVPYTAGLWYMITVVYGAVYNQIYINGSYNSQVDRTGDGLYIAAETPTIGNGMWAGSLKPFAGMIGFSRIYNRALTNSDISGIFNQQRYRFGV